MITDKQSLQNVHDFVGDLRRRTDAEKLAGFTTLIEKFRENGHNPADPHDPMYQAMDLAKDHVDLMLTILRRSTTAAAAPKPA